MKKVQTIYSKGMLKIAVNEEVKNHMSVYEGIEPCSGVLLHWGSRESLIKELEQIIAEIKTISLNPRMMKELIKLWREDFVFRLYVSTFLFIITMEIIFKV